VDFVACFCCLGALELRGRAASGFGAGTFSPSRAGSQPEAQLSG